MKNHLSFLFVFILLSFTKTLVSQENPNYKHLIRASIGLGYDDGLIYLKSPPVLGIAYEYKLSKRFSLATHFLWYYRTMSGFVGATYNGLANIELFEGTQSPLVNRAEKIALEESGIVQLSDYERFLKWTSIPIDLGLSFYPIRSSKHNLGINFAYSLTYENINWYRDLYSGGRFIGEDGSDYSIAFAYNKEIRNISQGFSLKLFYEYHFKDYLLGTRISNYNIIALPKWDTNQTVWESSLYFGFKF